MSLNQKVRTVEIPRKSQQGLIGSRITSRVKPSRRGGLMLEQRHHGRFVFVDDRSPKPPAGKLSTFEICAANADATVLFAKVYQPDQAQTGVKAKAKASTSLPALRIGFAGHKIVALNRTARPLPKAKSRRGKVKFAEFRHASPNDLFDSRLLNGGHFVEEELELGEECEVCGEYTCTCDEEDSFAHLPVRLSGCSSCGHYDCRCDGTWMGVPVHRTAATGLF